MSGSATSFDDSRAAASTSQGFRNPPGTSHGQDGERPSDADWGLSGAKSGLSREMKIGLVLILLLAGVFAWVVYRKIQNANEFPDGVATTHDRSDRRNRHVEPLPADRDGSQTTGERRGSRRRTDGAATTTAHNEPPFGGQKSNSNEGTPPGGNPFEHVSATTPRDGSATTGDGSSGNVRIGGFPSGQTEPNGDPFSSRNHAGGMKSGSATTVDNSAKSGSPWDLDGGSGKASAAPVGSATTVDRGQPAGDGFQNADPNAPRHTGPFGRRGRDAGSRYPRHVGAKEPPQGVFGGNFEPSGAATTTDSGTTARDGSASSRTARHGDSRLGPYRFASSQRRHAGSTTTVQTGGSDVDHPFGTSSDPGSSKTPLPNGGATTGDNGSSFSANLQAGGPPATLDGQDIQYGNDRPRVHVVGHGDNYWTISRRAFGTARYFQVLAEYNRHRIPDPRRMRPGMKVLVPTVEVLAARYPKLCPAGHQGTGLVVHGVGHRSGGFFRDQAGSPMFRVGKTDTLSEIAQKHLGRTARWIQIYHMNRDRVPNPNRLTIGTELRLPADASNIRVVRGGGEFR